MKRRGLTLLEILISTLIMALVTAGLANIFIAGKKHILRTRSRMAGGELGKYFLDPLQMDVRQDQWNSNCLGANIACPTTPQTFDAMTFEPVYTITHNFYNTTLNKVEVKIKWTQANETTTTIN